MAAFKGMAEEAFIQDFTRLRKDRQGLALMDKGNGECIFRDLDGRAGRIGVDLVSDELLRWLDTNPTHDKPDRDGHDDLQGGVGRPQEVRS